jgi:hypothetical protein
MTKSRLKRASVLACAAAFALALLAGCTFEKTFGSSSAAGSQSGAFSAGSASQAVSSAPAGSSSGEASDAGNSAGFHGLGSDVLSTIYDAGTTITESPKTFSGSYDLDGDGKSENISMTFYRVEDANQDSALQIGGSTLKIGLVELAGLYVVDLDKSDRFKEVAVVEHGESDYMKTYFFRYDGSGIVSLGSIHGEIDPDPADVPYNSALMTNGSGMLIPALGMMEYISPEIIIDEYQVAGGKLTEQKPDISGALNKQYTISMDTQPFFEPMDSVPTGFEPTYDSKYSTNLSKGQALTITQIKGFEWVDAKLADGRQGALYYFLMS